MLEQAWEPGSKHWVLGLRLWVPGPLHGCAVRVGAELSASQALPCCSQSVFGEECRVGATGMTVHWLAVIWLCQSAGSSNLFSSRSA